ncbi:MAG: hypothetical protein ABMB14_31540 [Myxococcota bacterium]
MRGYDRDAQLGAVWTAARAAERRLPRARASAVPWRGLAVVVGLVAAAGWLGVRLGRRVLRRLLDPPDPGPRGPVARGWPRARRLVEARGWAVPSALPPVAAAAWVAERAPGDAADALVELAWLYYGVHLGRADPGPAAVRARALSARIEALPAATRAG